MKKEFFPDYRLGVEYRSFRSSEDMVMFTAGIELPIWLPGKLCEALGRKG